jgi:hypothetical protein
MSFKLIMPQKHTALESREVGPRMGTMTLPDGFHKVEIDQSKIGIRRLQLITILRKVARRYPEITRYTPKRPKSDNMRHLSWLWQNRNRLNNFQVIYHLHRIKEYPEIL